MSKIKIWRKYIL